MNNSEKIFLDRENLHELRERISDVGRLLQALGIRPARENAREIWAFSPFRPENTASFHIRKPDCAWHDFGDGSGGGPLELIARLKNLDIYSAGRWALANGLAGESCSERVRYKCSDPVRYNRPDKSNAPTEFDLRPFLQPHPEFDRRGISRQTCEFMGCGYLPKDTSRGALAGRIVFQVRGVRQADGEPEPVILTHIGRAVSPEDETQNGKWRFYRGFRKSVELMGLDCVWFHPPARQQLERTGRLILVEGAFDLAKLYEAGVYNAAACFGARLSEAQAGLLRGLAGIGLKRVCLFFDRDQAGREEATAAANLLRETGIEAEIFDWEHALPEMETAASEGINDPCEMSVEQLRGLFT